MNGIENVHYYCKKHKQSLICFIITILFLFLMIILIRSKLHQEILSYITYQENVDSLLLVPGLQEGDLVEQDFSSQYDFNCITLDFANDNASSDGDVRIEVWDLNDNILLADEYLAGSSIFSGNSVEIPLLQNGRSNALYRIKIKSESIGQNGIGVYGYKDETSQNLARINGVPSEYVLSIGIHEYSNSFLNLFRLTLSILVLGFLVLGFFCTRKKLEPQIFFLIIAIPLGLIFLSFLSANPINDEDVHFASSYHYANVILGMGDSDTEQSLIMRNDDTILKYSSECMDSRNAQNYGYIVKNWKLGLHDDGYKKGIEWRNTSCGNYFVYFPSIAAIVIARLLGLGTYPMMMLAKLFPFILYLIGIYYSIKITPIGKHLLLFIGALPMSLQQATGISYDTISIIILFLVISLILKAYYECLTKRQWILLVVLSACLGFCKGGIYTPALLIWILVPSRHFLGVGKKWACILGVCLLTMCTTMLCNGKTISSYLELNQLEQSASVTVEGNAESVEDAEEIVAGFNPYGVRYAFDEPARFIKMIGYTLVVNADFYIEGVFGAYVAWASQKLPLWSYILFIVVLLLSKNGIGEGEYRVGGKMRLGMLTAFVAVVIVHFVLFLIETFYGRLDIWGIQGRYFIPVLPFLLLSLRNNKVKQESDSDKSLYLTFYMGMFLYWYGYFELFMTQTYRV